MILDLLPRVRELRSAGLGARRIAPQLGISKDAAHRLVKKIELEELRSHVPATPGNAISLYDTACRALAEAVRVDEIQSVLDVAAAIDAYGRQAKNHEIEANGVVLRERAERKLGEKLIEAKRLGQIAEGRPPKENGSVAEPFRVTLEAAGIDKKLSMRAQRKAGIAAKAYEAMLGKMRDDIVSGRRSNDILKIHPINGARSVMGSRQEPDDSLDYFPTPPWATRALMEQVIFANWLALRVEINRAKAWEPACGEGHIAEVLKEYFDYVATTDIHDYGYGTPDYDFLHRAPDPPVAFDWIITNPPFSGTTDRALEFTLRALELASVGVAIFVRSQWAVEGIERYERLFLANPPTLFAPFVERVNLCKGRWDPKGGTATAYCWLVWIKGKAPLPTYWIPPGRRMALTHPDDIKRFAAWSMPPRPREGGEPDTGEITEAVE